MVSDAKPMSEQCENLKQPSNNFHKLLRERIEKANPRRNLTAEETNRLSKLEGIADKPKRGEHVQKSTKLQNLVS